jgi:hypothetical protein
VFVPPPGQGVWAVATLVGGGERTLSARTLGDGTVIVRASQHHPTAADDASDPCADDAYATYAHAWINTFEWYVKIGSRPKKLGRARTVAAFRRAARNLTEARNDCGLSDEIEAEQQYGGTTKTPMNVGADSSCLTPDDQSVLGFGDLGKGVIAFTCWWTENGELVSSDIKLNKVHFEWTIAVTPSCKRRWSVEAVLTHELGHTFGLDHVSEEEHGALTMSEVIRACQASEVTLGLGDILGLQSKY